jgi:hypothetical protein
MGGANGVSFITANSPDKEITNRKHQISNKFQIAISKSQQG